MSMRPTVYFLLSFAPKNKKRQGPFILLAVKVARTVVVVLNLVCVKYSAITSRADT